MEDSAPLDESGSDRLAFLWARAMVLGGLLLLLLSLTGEGFPPGALRSRVRLAASGDLFDLVSWELGSLVDKLTYALVAPQRYLDEAARHDLFLRYLQTAAEAQALSRRIELLYTDPAVRDPERQAAPLRAELRSLRRDLVTLRPMVEAILQEQTAAVLYDAGFGALGQVWPPVSERLTFMPTLLVISPRDHIENVYSLVLQSGLDAARREEIEGLVDAPGDVSSLVTDIGGLSTYPTMLLQVNSLPWLANVSAHEWTHIYLLQYPLGRSYDAGPESLTINETVASIVGEEVGRLTLRRFYPELPAGVSSGSAHSAATEGEESPPFDFRREMRRTRVHVDALLAQGKVAEAEEYMEERRQVFVAHGYRIRKLNQAYFAFHGSYADKPGAAGEDPVGPAVLRLRARSPDLHSFVVQVAHVTTLEQLQALLEAGAGG